MSKTIRVSLVLAALTSMLYLLMLGYYALPTADDWAWSRWVEELNPFGFVKNFYLTWQGRYSALLIDGALCQYIGWSEHLLGFTIVELLLGYGAIYLLLRDMLKLPNSVWLAIAAIIIANLGIMAFPEIGTFYWLCTTNYIHEIWITLYLVWFIYCCQTTWLQWVGTILCSVYLGGSAENYSPVVALAMGTIWLIDVIREKEWRIWLSKKQALLFVSTMVIGIGCLVMILAPGNDVRMAAEGSESLMKHFSISIFCINTIKASVVLLLRLLSRAWYFVLALPICCMIGAWSDQSLPPLTWKRVLLSLACSIGVIVISVAATVYGVGWYATMRANCFITFVFIAWIAYVGILIGHAIKEKKILIVTAALGAMIAISATSIIYIVKEYPIVRKYNQDVIAIHHRLQQYVAEGRIDTVYVKPIQIPCQQSSYGYLRNALQVVFHKSKRYHECYFPYEPFQLEANHNDWRNQFYKRWLNAQFDIVYADEEMAQ